MPWPHDSNIRQSRLKKWHKAESGIFGTSSLVGSIRYHSQTLCEQLKISLQWDLQIFWDLVIFASMNSELSAPGLGAPLEDLIILLKKMVQTWKWYFWDQLISRINLAWVWHLVPSALDFTSMGLRNFLRLSHFYFNEFWADGTRSQTHAKVILLMSWLQRHHFQVCTIFFLQDVPKFHQCRISY